MQAPSTVVHPNPCGGFLVQQRPTKRKIQSMKVLQSRTNLAAGCSIGKQSLTLQLKACDLILGDQQGEIQDKQHLYIHK